ncbi:C40 family peptidase [Leptonema illini]|jgi:peptidoglycan endopeptidase LytE|uniref:NLP/P60 protein n=1 Tax=Leptonema illini DSM 21528 TaxID=929563 RepID=H2CJJ6_9LEPT|nr:C40 family peptidase [Leptonema illini]EHQ07153.1 NLP/P60 protein [Leptonema illini DSM 21528]
MTAKQRLILICAILSLGVVAVAAEHKDRRITVYDGTGIVELADQYIGTPYKLGGNTPAGFDCSGFTSFVYSKAGYKLSRTADGQFAELRPIKQPEIGDLVFFRISGDRISHVGIYVGDLKFIHAPSSGKTVEYADMRIAYWKTRYAGARSVFQE